MSTKKQPEPTRTNGPAAAAVLARQRAQELRAAQRAGYWWVAPSEVAALLEEIASMIEPPNAKLTHEAGDQRL